MAAETFTQTIPGQPLLSLLVWGAALVLVLYFARAHVHATIRAASRVVHNGLRLAAHAVGGAERRLAQRNREVLLASGLEAVERQVEREFHRVDAVVARDLQGFPALQRELSEQITRIDEDYRESGEIPPAPSAWVSAVEAVAKIKVPEGGMVASMLGDIKATLEKHQQDATEEYRRSVRKRHALLHRMMPYWRRLSVKLGEVGKSIRGLQERAASIDRHMAAYEEIQRGTDRAVRTLSSSSMTQFVISGFVLAVAVGGAMINFNLIALPMSEMVGGGSYIGAYKTSDVAALVIILVETAMGLYLMESLRITRLFPVIGSLDDRVRVRMIWISFGILLVLAGVESALAFMRDRIAADMQALRQTLAGVQETARPQSLIPTVGQMVMGFILPFALTFVAIPLESFIQSARTVAGVALQGLLRTLAFLLRLAGNLARYAGSALIALYDAVIFLPILVERRLRRAVEGRRSGTDGGRNVGADFDPDRTAGITAHGAGGAE